MIHRMGIYRFLLAALFLTTAVGRAFAQLTPLSSLTSGDTVRVWAVQPRLNGDVGIFDRLAADTLRFTQPSPSLLPTAVAYPNLRRIDVRRGVHRSPGRILLGTIVGAGAGMIVGGYLGTWIECGSHCGDEGDLEGLAGLLLGGASGLLAGGVTGGIITARHRVPRWDPVDLRRR